MLHITNGDEAARLLKATGFEEVILAWRDVLHEGPVPAGHNLHTLSDVRANHLSRRNWGTKHALLDAFRERNDILERFHEHDEVVLWFEHDLYDQLQIAQILDFFATRKQSATNLSMICIDRYPDIPSFRGLCDLAPEHVTALFGKRQSVTHAQLLLAVAVWEAFCRPTPDGLVMLLKKDTSPLPFMAAALRRHLESFPSVRNGLGRTEHHALGAIASGIEDPVVLLKAHWKQEEYPFMGDWTYWAALKDLASGAYPLIDIQGPHDDSAFPNTRLSLTHDGSRVLAGDRDAIALNGIDRWFGGVHLKGSEARWRWSRTAHRFATTSHNAGTQLA